MSTNTVTCVTYLIGSCEWTSNRNASAGLRPALTATREPLAFPVVESLPSMPKRVLIVDDHAPTRTLVRSILEAEPGDTFTVVEAASGMECLKAVDAEEPFDLVILDVGLPDMEGYEVCKALRNVDKHLPIVFVTARGEMKDFAAGRAAGADSYLVKPIARAAVRSIVGLFTSVGRKKPSESESAAK